MSRKLFKYHIDFTFINSKLESINPVCPSLHLDNSASINIYCLWRLTKRDRVLVNSIDYKDEETMSKSRGLFYQLLLNKKVLDLTIYDNGDLILKFEKDLCLEIYPDKESENNWDIAWPAEKLWKEIVSGPGGEVKFNEDVSLSSDIDIEETK